MEIFLKRMGARMPDDWGEKAMAVLLAVIFTIALGPWIVDRLWQIPAVREFVFNILLFIAVVAVIGLYVLYRNSGGR
jgi:hypothetical protein